VVRKIGEFYDARDAAVRSEVAPFLDSLAQTIAGTVAEELSSQRKIEAELDVFTRAFEGASVQRYVEASRATLLRAAKGATDPAAAMREEVASWSSTRSTTAARQESVRAVGAFTAESLRLHGAREKTWVNLEPECSLCSSMHLRRVPIGDFFLAPGDHVGDLEVKGRVGHAPLHNGCTCGLAA
jgi:hypothetical protein